MIFYRHMEPIKGIVAPNQEEKEGFLQRFPSNYVPFERWEGVWHKVACVAVEFYTAFGSNPSLCRSCRSKYDESMEYIRKIYVQGFVEVPVYALRDRWNSNIFIKYPLKKEPVPIYWVDTLILWLEEWESHSNYKKISIHRELDQDNHVICTCMHNKRKHYNIEMTKKEEVIGTVVEMNMPKGKDEETEDEKVPTCWCALS